jgi:hypothetical protein
MIKLTGAQIKAEDPRGPPDTAAVLYRLTAQPATSASPRGNARWRLTSANGPGCVKTRLNEERAEFFSQLASSVRRSQCN